MRRFKSKAFARFARREGISDAALGEALERLVNGLVDADLGGGLYKQRVARPEEGRSGGYRTLVCFRRDERAFFVYGFPKSARANISAGQGRDLKKLAAVLLNLPDDTLQAMLADNSLIEF
ncbi:MAG: type II toxin-antitoxin system RelE/ParE family toxin [Desulfovibrio sp.]|nr:type II toxin-antitoxin system RelE/ParE family toxin [Desulfovibrio sp.]